MKIERVTFQQRRKKNLSHLQLNQFIWIFNSNFQMCKIIRSISNMQRSEFLSKIKIVSIAIICAVSCIPSIIIGVIVVGFIGLMSVYYCYQNTCLQHQMIGLFVRCGLQRLTFTHLTTSQKHLHFKNNNRWHCENKNLCVLVPKLWSTMRINMPVMMMGMYQ